MGADANGVFLVGRLTRDAESKTIGEGTVFNLRLAFTTRRKVRETWEDRPNYVDVSYWGSAKLEQWLVKGRQIAVTGGLSYREWQATDGTKRSVVEVRASDIQLLGDGGQSSGASGAKEAAPRDDGDIPF